MGDRPFWKVLILYAVLVIFSEWLAWALRAYFGGNTTGAEMMLGMVTVSLIHRRVLWR